MFKILQKLSIALFVATAAAAHADAGLGIVLGQPTGISGRMDTSATTAFDAALAWRMGNSKYVIVHADHLWIKPKLVGPSSINADLYYGVGAILSLPESDVGGALRLPVGVSRKFKDPDLELFAELAIAFLVIPDTDFDVVGGVGLRWWF